VKASSTGLAQIIALCCNAAISAVSASQYLDSPSQWRKNMNINTKSPKTEAEQRKIADKLITSVTRTEISEALRHAQEMVARCEEAA
jgi:hypothetical protein